VKPSLNYKNWLRRVTPKVSQEVRRVELAYIAGFLDGDGCIMLQLVPRKGYILGYQIRASIVFYQKLQYRSFLEEIKERLIYGYIRERKDSMVEYTIVGLEPVESALTLLYPYLKLKKKQAQLALEIIGRISKKVRASNKEKIDAKLLMELSSEVDKFALLNYSKRRTNTSEKVKEFLESHNLLNPVETDP